MNRRRQPSPQSQPTRIRPTRTQQSRAQQSRTQRSSIARAVRCPQLVVGLLLIAAAWPLYWTTVSAFLMELFAVLWLGYILSVDGLVYLRTGTSLLSRSASAFAVLFVLSTGFWWIYECFNLATHNWSYTIPDQPGPAVFAVAKTLCFSTVIPALFETAELLRSRRRTDNHPSPLDDTQPGSSRRAAVDDDDRDLSPRAVTMLVGLGIICAVATPLWPHIAYTLMWPAGFLILDPINAVRGDPSLLLQIRRGRWADLGLWSVAGLICGLVWEMWNSRTAAQWIYNVPGFNGSPHLFRMPLPGFAGYIPFAWSAYAFAHTGFGLLRIPARDTLGTGDGPVIPRPARTRPAQPVQPAQTIHPTPSIHPTQQTRPVRPARRSGETSGLIRPLDPFRRLSPFRTRRPTPGEAAPDHRADETPAT